MPVPHPMSHRDVHSSAKRPGGDRHDFQEPPDDFSHVTGVTGGTGGGAARLRRSGPERRRRGSAPPIQATFEVIGRLRRTAVEPTGPPALARAERRGARARGGGTRSFAVAVRRPKAAPDRIRCGRARVPGRGGLPRLLECPTRQRRGFRGGRAAAAGRMPPLRPSLDGARRFGNDAKGDFAGWWTSVRSRRGGERRLGGRPLAPAAGSPSWASPRT